MLTVQFVWLVVDSFSKKATLWTMLAAILSNKCKSGLQISIALLNREIRELVIHHLRVSSAALALAWQHVLFVRLNYNKELVTLALTSQSRSLGILSLPYVSVWFFKMNHWPQLDSFPHTNKWRCECSNNSSIIRPCIFVVKTSELINARTTIALWHNALAVGV